MKERFQVFPFQKPSLKRIDQANAIIAEYMAAGYTLTLRQLYYQFVARGLIGNEQKNYKSLGDLINKGRLAGLIDWRAIEDRTRNLSGYDGSDTTPANAMYSMASGYSEEFWKDQPYRPEVWVEKEALVGVIERACARHRLDFFACRGYVSQSEQYKAGKRMAAYKADGQIPIVFHLGDHDPSGIHMTQDNRDRLRMFSELGIEVRRLALNMDQVEQYSPPPNPAKETDSRFAGYREDYGDESWELDALDPPVITALVDDAVASIIDQSAWDRSEERQERNREDLQIVARNWTGVVKRLRYEAAENEEDKDGEDE